MTPQDIAFAARCAWGENRGGGLLGMQSVINTLQNRGKRRGTDLYTEATRPEQYDALTTPGDPNLTKYPPNSDPQWQMALSLAAQAAAGTLADITEGAISYYALTMATPPYWAASMQYTVTIAGQKFYR
jgi:N-acetylmuramoyl-L-alanine amidase